MSWSRVCSEYGAATTLPFHNLIILKKMDSHCTVLCRVSPSLVWGSGKREVLKADKLLI